MSDRPGRGDSGPRTGPATHREGPVRTCVGCRVKASDSSLLRVVAVNGILVPDQRRRLPGRGAWLHPRVGCLDAAERRRAFGRALRLPEPLDSTDVRAFLIQDLPVEGLGSRTAEQGPESQPVALPEHTESRSTVVSTP